MPGWITNSDLAEWLGSAERTGADATAQSRIRTAVESAVEAACHRTFGTPVSETRLFDIRATRMAVQVGDIQADPEPQVEVREPQGAWEVLDASRWRLRKSSPGLPADRPHRWLRRTDAMPWPRGEDVLRVTADWGFGEPPEAIRQASVMMAVRLWQRRLAPMGVLTDYAGDERGTVVNFDADVQDLLNQYRLTSVA